MQVFSFCWLVLLFRERSKLETYYCIVFIDFHHTKLYHFYSLNLGFILKIFLKFLDIPLKYILIWKRECIMASASWHLSLRLRPLGLRWIRHTNPQRFESALQSGIFLIRYESGIVWTLNPNISLPLDVTRSSPVLYREYSRWLPSAMLRFFTFFFLFQVLQRVCS